MNRKIFEQAKKKLAELVTAWGKANVYMVGGCVRDIVMGMPPKDIDLCVDLPDGAVIFCDYLEKNHPTECKNFVVYPRFGTSKFSLVLGNGKELDIECVMPRVETYQAGPRKPDSVKYTTLEQDALRRDFCCNALYMNVQDEKILDPTRRGLEDIKNKILKTPLDPVATFTDDPLRMLRAVRFSCQKGFSIDSEVQEGITDYPEYYKLSMERVHDEFAKIMTSEDPVTALWFLHEHKLLKYIIPELEEAWGFNQNNHHHSMNLSDHSLKVLEGCLKGGLTLRLAALLHDISKYKIYKVKDNGEFSYPKHHLDSADMAEAIMRRLKFPESEISEVKFLIRNHMCIKPFYDKSTGKYNRGGATTRKIARLLGDHIKDEMTLIKADSLAHAPGHQMPGQVESFWEEYDKEVVDYKESPSQPVSGNVIIKELQVKPGKVIGEIKSIFQDWYDEDPTLTSEQLLEKFRETFVGKSLWITRVAEHYMITENPQVLTGFYYTPDPYQIPFEIAIEELPGFPVSSSPVHVKAEDYPILYKRWTLHDILRKTLKEHLYPALDELEKIPGLGKISLTLEGNDLTGCIEWDGYAPEYIM